MIIHFSYTQDYKFDHITANDGLGDNYVRRLYEDSYGFIWIGTKDGLSRYDGYEIKTYKKEKNSYNTLPSGYIGAIVEDKNKNLWIGTGNGLSKYEREFDRFTNFSFSNNFKNAIYGLQIDSVYLWIATMGGLCRFNMQTGEQTWLFSEKSKVPLPVSDILRILFDKDHTIWVALTSDRGIYKLNTRTFEYQHFYKSDTRDDIPGNNSVVLYNYNDSQLLLGISNIGPVVFNKDGSGYKILHSNDIKTESGFSMPRSLFVDRQRNIWIGTINGGLFKFDSTLTQSQNYIPYESNTDGINSLSISEIIGDRHGNIWFATHGGGVNVLYRRKVLFNHFKRTPHTESINHNYVSNFHETNDGKIWIATDGGGLNLFNKENLSFKSFTIKDGIGSNAVLSILPYDNNNLLLATWDGGVSLFNYRNFKAKQFLKYSNEDEHSLSYKNIKNAMRIGDSVYVATHGDGINIYDIVNNKIYHHKKKGSKYEELFLPRNGNKILVDSLSNIWVATNFGLYKMKDNHITEYLPDTLNPNSIMGTYVTDIFIDKNNQLWVGSLSGLNLYDYKNDEFISFPKQIKLNSAIMSINQDNVGDIWLGLNSGLLRYNPEKDEVMTFDKTDGLQGNQFFERSSFKDSRGNMYFGGVNGFNTFDPSLLSIDTTEPTIYISDFKIFNKSQSPQDKESVLYRHINFTEEVSVKYSQKVISIEFIAIDLLNATKNEYAYILEGFDEHWYYVGKTNKVTYTNLSPGTYTFRIKACNADKFWSEKEKQLVINVLPPWWMTWWFRLMVFIIVAFTINLIYFLRTRNIKRLNKMLEHKVRIRTAELVENKEELQVNNERLMETINTKDRFFSIIAHDLKNPMNTLIGFSELLINRWKNLNEDKKQKYIEMINSSSNHLFELLTNLLDWSRSQTGSIKVNFEVISIKDVIHENVLLLFEHAKNKNIELTGGIESDLYALADINMVNTIIRNLVSNAIKYTSQGGEIFLSAYGNNNQVCILVRDNGVGMTENQLQSIFKVDKNVSTPGTQKEKGTGLGLIVSQEFAKINNGSISVKSILGKGTEFKLFLQAAR